MSESFIMSKYYIIMLAKLKGLLNFIKLIKFLEPWDNISKHVQEIFYYLEKNCLPPNPKAFVSNFQFKVK